MTPTTRITEAVLIGILCATTAACVYVLARDVKEAIKREGVGR